MSKEQAKADTTQQATAPAPTTKPAKNPKRVAAGKAAAQKTKEAREAQKKALAEAEKKPERPRPKPQRPKQKILLLPPLLLSRKPQQKNTNRKV